MAKMKDEGGGPGWEFRAVKYICVRAEMEGAGLLARAEFSVREGIVGESDIHLRGGFRRQRGWMATTTRDKIAPFDCTQREELN